MNSRLLFSILLTIVHSCVNVATENRQNSGKESAPKLATADRRDKDISNTDEPFVSHYQCDTAKSFRDNILEGWMDTFSINSRRFRLRLDSADIFNEVLTMEYYKDSGWVKNTGFGYYNWDFGFIDVNCDGYPDFTASHKRGYSVNFYNPYESLFDRTTWEISRISHELDSSGNIKYTWWVDDATPMISMLYTFRGIKPYYYYILFYQHGKTEDIHDENRFVGLWQCRNGLEDIDSAFLIKKIKIGDEDGDGFDCEKFWKANFRKLINQYAPKAPDKYYADYKVDHWR